MKANVSKLHTLFVCGSGLGNRNNSIVGLWHTTYTSGGATRV